MTDELPDAVERAFDGHDAYERRHGEFRLTTSAFEGTVTAASDPASQVVE